MRTLQEEDLVGQLILEVGGVQKPNAVDDVRNSSLPQGVPVACDSIRPQKQTLHKGSTDAADSLACLTQQVNTCWHFLSSSASYHLSRSGAAGRGCVAGLPGWASLNAGCWAMSSQVHSLAQQSRAAERDTCCPKQAVHAFACSQRLDSARNGALQDATYSPLSVKPGGGRRQRAGEKFSPE